MVAAGSHQGAVIDYDLQLCNLDDQAPTSLCSASHVYHLCNEVGLEFDPVRLEKNGQICFLCVFDGQKEWRQMTAWFVCPVASEAEGLFDLLAVGSEQSL